jgi:iron complex transport system permease protein
VLDAFAFGDRAAASLGVPVESVRWLLYGTVALLTASLVALAGAIGFVGLVVPHAVRLVLGPLHRRLLPVAALVGAIFLVWADTLARTLLGATEVPIGVLTAVVGVPLFVVLLRRERSTA